MSAENCRFLDELLHHGAGEVTHGTTTILVEQKVEHDLPCTNLLFRLPQTHHPSDVKTISVLVPNAWLGTPALNHNDIFSALIEEMIVWLARISPRHTLVRLHLENDNHAQRYPQSSSSEQSRNGFSAFINSLRNSQNHCSGLGQTSGSLGTMEVMHAMTSFNEVSAHYIVTLAPSTRQRMSVFVPRNIEQLPLDWLLDWLEVQDRFASQA